MPKYFVRVSYDIEIEADNDEAAQEFAEWQIDVITPAATFWSYPSYTTEFTLRTEGGDVIADLQ